MAMVSALIPTLSEKSDKTRWISCFSWFSSMRISLFNSNTAKGSINTVAPEDEVSCTSPRTSFLCSIFTGITYRPFRWVMMESCKAVASLADVIICCSVSRILPLASRIRLRILYNSSLASSAKVSSPMMARRILSSRALWGMSRENKENNGLSKSSLSAYSTP